jgi:hypothetical protein
MITYEDFAALHTELTGMLQAAGKPTDGFAFQVASADRYGIDGYKELEAAGATDIVTLPWVFYGVPIDGDLEAKQDGIRQFAADVIEKW